MFWYSLLLKELFLIILIFKKMYISNIKLLIKTKDSRTWVRIRIITQDKIYLKRVKRYNTRLTLGLNKKSLRRIFQKLIVFLTFSFQIHLESQERNLSKHYKSIKLNSSRSSKIKRFKRKIRSMSRINRSLLKFKKQKMSFHIFLKTIRIKKSQSLRSKTCFQ